MRPISLMFAPSIHQHLRMSFRSLVAFLESATHLLRPLRKVPLGLYDNLRHTDWLEVYLDPAVQVEGQ